MQANIIAVRALECPRPFSMRIDPYKKYDVYQWDEESSNKSPDVFRFREIETHLPLSDADQHSKDHIGETQNGKDDHRDRRGF